MTPGDPWQPLRTELDRWQQAGRRARFWLRDDDATEPGPALDELLSLTGRFGVPLTLAVIPAATGSALADRLMPVPGAAVAVHGWSHENHAPTGVKKQELGGHRPLEQVLAELSAGVEKLRGLHGPRYVPLLVPPWNRIDPALLPRLRACGFAGLSTFGPETAGPIATVNVQIDPIDWRGTRSCRETAVLVQEAVARLRTMFDDPGQAALGLMSHHLVHDAAVWAFTGRFLAETCGHPACRWVSVRELLPD